MACCKREALNYNGKILSGLFWTPTRRYAHVKSRNGIFTIWAHFTVFQTLRGCSDAYVFRTGLKLFFAVVQWSTFPTSHHVTRSDNMCRFFSSLTEIVRFWECFIFVPTCNGQWWANDFYGKILTWIAFWPRFKVWSFWFLTRASASELIDRVEILLFQRTKVDKLHFAVLSPSHKCERPISWKFI